MSKVVLYATSFYPELIKWNPLNIDIEDDWKHFERDWKVLGRPLNPLSLEPAYNKGKAIVTEPEAYKLAKSAGFVRNPYVGDWRRVGELGENYIYALGRLVRCPLPYDRTGDWNIFNVLYDPIPEIDNWNMTFSEVCHKRAQGLWRYDDVIRLWWSGGIDSTTTLTALLLNQPAGSELSILLSKASVIENPTFYEKIVKLGIPLEWTTKDDIWNANRFNGDALNITGECGDPMYGTFVVENHIEQINEPWQEIFKWDDVDLIYKITDDKPLNKPHFHKCMAFAEEYIKKCPFEIKTTFDFTWWLAFTIKWQWIDRRLFGYLDPPTGWRNMISFFNCDDFQKWSMTNHDLKHKGTWKTYKWPSKEFIYEFNKDSNYLHNKVKETSFPKTVPVGLKKIKNKLIMDNGIHYKRKESLDYDAVKVWDVFDKNTFDRIRSRMH